MDPPHQPPSWERIGRPPQNNPTCEPSLKETNRTGFISFVKMSDRIWFDSTSIEIGSLSGPWQYRTRPYYQCKGGRGTLLHHSHTLTRHARIENATSSHGCRCTISLSILVNRAMHVSFFDANRQSMKAHRQSRLPTPLLSWWYSN